MGSNQLYSNKKFKKQNKKINRKNKEVVGSKEGRDRDKTLQELRGLKAHFLLKKLGKLWEETFKHGLGGRVGVLNDETNPCT